MRKHLPSIGIALIFVALSSTVNAQDYESWTPLLPENIGGMDKNGDPKGMNAQKGGQSWSVLRQEYSDAEGSDARLSIVAGSEAPGIKQFKKMQQFEMETEEKRVRSLDISGYKAVIEFDKKGGDSHLFIAVQNNAVVIIGTDAFDNEEDLISLSDKLPLSEIAESSN